jgi:pectin methylesterase-like acyl-CoA thioesterase
MYVSRSGSNHFPGTFYQPYQTINKAIESAVAGDKIIILPGFYNENIECKNIQGAETQKIIIRGHGDVVINNPEESEDALVILKSCQFIEFENMTFNANDKTGISVMGSSNISIKNCRIKRFVKTAIRVQGTKDSHFSYNEVITGESLKTQKQPGIQVDNNESSVVFENNWFRTYL